MKPIERVETLPCLSPRKPDSHKGMFGKVLVVAGSRGMVGAACLASEAAMRSGAGLVTLGTPASLLPVAAAKLTCAMTYPLSETALQTLAAPSVQEILDFAADCQVLALGPGLSAHPETSKVVRTLLPALSIPVVVDADGLNALVGQTEVLTRRSAPTVMTPHPGEFARLIGCSTRKVQAQRKSLAVQWAAAWQVVLVLKGSGTVVTDGRRLYLNSTGNPGMASGGSGDVLTGVIAALIAQGMEAFAAAQLGTWAHGRAGDLVREELGEIGMMASDLLLRLPLAFREQQKVNSVP